MYGYIFNELYSEYELKVFCLNDVVKLHGFR